MCQSLIPYAVKDLALTVGARQADCNDLEAAEAILGGLKSRYEKTGQVPILIHTVRGLHAFTISFLIFSTVRNGRPK
jgi:hypothetical protein